MILYSINENNAKQLNEGITDKTYHFCSINNCLNILRSNKFGCSVASNDSDAHHKNKLFYISAQRSKHPRLGYASVKSRKGNLPIARIELDGYLLKQDGYEGKPIDYWHNSLGKQTDIGPNAQRVASLGRGAEGKDILKAQQNNENFEHEDRIFSDKPYLSLQYVSRIDILSLKGNKEGSKSIKRCILLGKRNGVSVYVYNNEKDFVFQTENTINSIILKTKYDVKDFNLTKLNITKPDYQTIFKLVAMYIYDDAFKNFNDENTKALIKKTLDKYGLNSMYPYFIDHLSNFYSYNLNGSSVRDNAFTLANDLQRMPLKNHSIYEEKILLLAQDVLRKFNVNSFFKLGSLFCNCYKKEDKVKTIVEFVPCIKHYTDYENNPNSFVIRRADKRTLWEFINKETFYENISSVVDEFDSCKEYHNKYGWEMPNQKVFHKSKNSESFKKYLQHLTYNDNLSLYDGAKILMKIFNNDLKEMNECIWLTIEPIDLAKEDYIKYEEHLSSLDAYGKDGIEDSLFSNWDEYYNLRKEIIGETKITKKIYIDESKLSVLKQQKRKLI